MTDNPATMEETSAASDMFSNPWPDDEPVMAELALPKTKAVPVLYVDLDGTVRQGEEDLGHPVNHPDEVTVFPSAVELMKQWKMAGGRIAGVTNAGAVALGEVEADHILQAMIRTQEQSGYLFDLVQICFHHPDAADPENARCWCRKPSAGAVAEAVFGLHARYPGEYYPPHLSLFVGDQDVDRQCAENAMIDFMWAKEWRATAFGPNPALPPTAG